MKINKILTATYSLNLIYDDNAPASGRDPSGGLSSSLLLGVGLAVKVGR